MGEKFIYHECYNIDINGDTLSVDTIGIGEAIQVGVTRAPNNNGIWVVVIILGIILAYFIWGTVK